MRQRSVLSSLLLLLALASPLLAQEQREFNLRTASVANIQNAVAAGALTYQRLVQLYLDRIEAYDQQGPSLNAILEINPRALEIARELDEERRTSGLRSPLHGIPIVVKDAVDVHDIPSAGGNVALAGTYPLHDTQLWRGRPLRRHSPSGRSGRLVLEPACPMTRRLLHTVSI